MKYLVAVLFYIYSCTGYGGGITPLMFTPIALPGVDLKWDTHSYQFDGYGGGGYPATFTLTNYGIKRSNLLTVTLNGGDPSYTLLNDTCTGVKLAFSASCTVDIHYNGPNSLLPWQYLHVEDTDGKTTPQDITIKNCNAC
jgi:hypothetical protein